MMRTAMVATLVMGLGIGVSASSAPALAQLRGVSPMPAFSAYPATPYTGRAAPLRLTGTARRFATRIREAYADEPVFAGSVAIAEIGCGIGCNFAYAADRRTGAAIRLPDGGPDGLEVGYDYRPDSRLLMVRWRIAAAGPERCAGAAYTYATGVFTRIRHYPVPCDS